MTSSVSAGNSATFTLNPFATLTLSSSNGQGEVRFISQAPKLLSDQRLSVQNGTFGPWGVPMVVTINMTQGSATYTATDTARSVTQDASTGGLVGPDGSISLGSYGLTGVSYDGSNRVTGFTINNVTYTVSGWGGTSIAIAGSDGTTRTITLDGSSRISEVA